MLEKLKIYSSIIGPVIFITSSLLISQNAYSSNEFVGTGPSITHELVFSKVDRVEVLENFFSNYNSPLKDHADTFVAVADKYELDYTLLPAISCMESTCGKRMIPNTYNPFGWGIYGSQYIAFEDFDHAIETVGEGISRNYVSKGLDTPAKIAPVYTPPNPHGWLNGVNFFRSKINLEEQANQIKLASNIEIPKK